MLLRQRFNNREEWLEGRTAGIGASDAAAVIGQSPWMTTMQLWRQKIGADTPKEMSANAAIEKGNRMEPALRTMYAAMNPDMTLEYYQFDILSQSERPWLRATLDGELTDSQGRKGILEIKTSTPNSAVGWAKWKDAIPTNYYAQVLHQLLATGWEYVILFACLFGSDGDATLRSYRFEKNELLDEMEWLLKEETSFWGFVQNGMMPPVKITF